MLERIWPLDAFTHVNVHAAAFKTKGPFLIQRTAFPETIISCASEIMISLCQPQFLNYSLF